MCEPCNFGRYQNLLGQTLCKSCSDGYTTAIVGAQDISLCTGNFVVQKYACLTCTSFNLAFKSRLKEKIFSVRLFLLYMSSCLGHDISVVRIPAREEQKFAEKEQKVL